MKKFIKSIPVYLTVVMLLCSLLVVPAFASSDAEVIEPFYTITDYVSIDDLDLLPVAGAYSYEFILPVGTYCFKYGSFESVSVNNFPADYILLKSDPVSYKFEVLPFSSDCVFAVTEDMLVTDDDPDYKGLCSVFINSYMVEPVVTVYNAPVIDNPGVDLPPEGDDVGVQKPLYPVVFDFFADLIYGEGADLSVAQNYVLTFVATIVCLTALLLVVVVPFLILFFVLSFFR